MLNLSRSSSTAEHASSSALIDQMLPAEIISHIIMYDLSTAIAAREVSTYWRSFVDWSDVKLSELVLHQIRQSKRLWKETLVNARFSFAEEPDQSSGVSEMYDPIHNYTWFDSEKKKWRLRKDSFTSKEMIKNVCAAEKRGKHLVVFRPDELRVLHGSYNYSRFDFSQFMVLTSGTVYYDQSGVYKDWLIGVGKHRILKLIRPSHVPLPSHPESPVSFILDLEELLNAKPKYQGQRMNTPTYNVKIFYARVLDPLAWTFGIFPNSADMLMELSTLLLAVGLFSLFVPRLPTWNVYSLVSLILAIFLWNFKTNNLFYQPAIFLWFLAPVIANHVFMTSPSRMIYDAVGNLIWIILGILYVILAEEYLIKDKKLASHPIRKKATIVIAALFIVASFDLPKIAAAILNFEIFAKIAYSVVLLICLSLYIAGARILFDPTQTIPVAFRQVVQTMTILQERTVIIRLSIAILIRVLINYF